MITIPGSPARPSNAPDAVRNNQLMVTPNGVVTVPAAVGNPGSVAPRTLSVNFVGPTTTAGQIYIFNNNVLNAIPAAVTVGVLTYSDGFLGRAYERLILLADAAGPGLRIFGFNVTAVDGSGNPYPAIFNSMNMQLLQYTGYGSSAVPTNIDLSGAERNTQFNDSLLTVRTDFYLTALSQITFTSIVAISMTFAFFTTPDFVN